MTADKAHIIAQLQKDLLPLQGIKKAAGSPLDIGWGAVDEAFPNKTFPIGAMHEFLTARPEDKAATAGFISGIMSALMKKSGAALWISRSRTLFPPALKYYGIEPHHIIFVDLQRERDVLWAMEEALKCNGISAVIGEISELSFNSSRRLQLAVETSCVTGFILRHEPRHINTTACVSRWRITSLPGIGEDGLPGVGFPNWKVELLKIRNGKPGTWNIGWTAGRFRSEEGILTSITRDARKKVI
ncbi:MAG: Error-prone repair protein ImuA [Pedobacter sp.]|nr:MAG: Error-prone repair protein ImuA [Pedobacter sp.]